MKTRASLLCLAAGCLAASPLLADVEIDGVNLLVQKEQPQDSIRLNWTGGQPMFTVTDLSTVWVIAK